MQNITSPLSISSKILVKEEIKGDKLNYGA